MKSKNLVVGTAIVFLFGCAPRSHSTKNQAPPSNTSANQSPPTSTQSTNSNNSQSANPTQTAPPTRGELLAPITAAVVGAQAKLGEIPNDIPPATAINTKGGRLLVGYLRGTFSGELVVDQIFKSEKSAPYRLAEISAAILKLRNAGQFTAEDEDKVQLLQTAVNKRLIQTISYHEKMDQWIKYGVSAGVGAVAGFYAPELIDAGSGVLDSSVVQAPKNIIVKGWEAFVNGFKRGYKFGYDTTTSLLRRGGKVAAEEAATVAGEKVVGEEAAQVASQTAAQAGATAQTEEVAAAEAAVDQAAQESRPETVDDLAGTVGEGFVDQTQEMPAPNETVGQADQPNESTTSQESATTPKAKSGLYSRVVGAYKSRFNRLTSEEVVVRDVARALSSPELARGFEVIRIPEEQLDAVKTLKFSRTGIPGFRMNQMENSSFLTIRTAAKSGYEYFYVRGRAIETITEDGRKIVTSGPTIISIAANRMRGWAQDTVGFFKTGAGKVKSATLDSRVVQALTSQAGKRWIQSTAVGGATSMLTLWALNPIDTRYLTVNDYLLALSKKGINLNDFPDELRTELQNEAKVPKKLAQPLD